MGLQFPQHFQSAIVDWLASAETFSYQLLDDKDLSEQVTSAYLPLVYGKAKVAWHEHCPIGELLGPPPKGGAHLEYKSPFRTRADSGELFKPLQTASLKSVAAFLNSRGAGPCSSRLLTTVRSSASTPTTPRSASPAQRR